MAFTVTDAAAAIWLSGEEGKVGQWPCHRSTGKDIREINPSGNTSYCDYAGMANAQGL